MVEKMRYPLVSAVIPTYNSSRYIEECVDSILAQSYRHIEVVVIDDGSTDNTIEILGKYGDSVRILCQENAGTPVARDAGVRAARGELIALMDHDDLWEASKIEKQVDAMLHNEKAVLSYCDFRTIDGAGREIESPSNGLESVRSGNVFRELLNRTAIIVSSTLVLFRKSAYVAVGGCDSSVPAPADDYYLWVRMATQGEVVYVPEVLASYRRHGANQTMVGGAKIRGMLSTLMALRCLSPYVRSYGDALAEKDYYNQLYSIYLRIGQYYWHDNAYAESLPYYREARRLEPLSFGAHWKYIRAYLMRKTC